MSEKKDDDAIAIMVGDEKENGKDKDMKKKKGKKGEEPDEMSDEDKALKEGLELAVNRIKEAVSVIAFIISNKFLIF